MADKVEVYDVDLTQNAETDLNEIISYIAKENPRTALEILKRLQDKIETLDHFPFRGGYVPELLKKNIKEYRQLIESPWRIIYKVEKETVQVLTIVDSRRNLQDVLVEKLVR
jgi:addiction module RelE/StbE family toxin